MHFRSRARVFVLALVVIASSASTATADSGIKFGPTFAKFSSDTFDFNSRTGWHGGLFFGGKRSGVFGLQGELNWIRKQAGIDGQNIRIDYLQVPALLRLNIGSRSANGLGVYGIAGPAVDIKIADEIQGITLDNGFEGADVSLIFGGGIEVARIIVEGRYTKGFRRINKAFAMPAEIKTQSFSLLFGIRFN
jgi:hypothetical protein